MRNADSFVEQIKRLIESNDLSSAGQRADRALRWFPKDVRLWRLLGVIRGNQERHIDARKAFLTAYEIGGSDIDIANCLTAMLALDEIQTAIDILKMGFASFDSNSKFIIATSLQEAIRIGVIDFMLLPFDVQVYLKKFESGDL